MQLAVWLTNQIKNHKKKSEIMTNETIHDTFTIFLQEYGKYFMSNDEIWHENLSQIEEYINKNNKRPSQDSDNKYIKQLGKWLSHQIENYNRKTQIMKEDNIYNKFTIFLQKYNKYFMSNNEIWNENLNQLKIYINKNKKKPSLNDDNNEVKQLSKWLYRQFENYNKKIQTMKDDYIRNQFINFYKEYKQYLSNYDKLFLDV